ncbi:hypothetical protein WN944_019295 [Citrus x changshan-huyou]|uniref:Uncharacterized protein n=1 Tax=Citrus x changshan-huyou TaxID=2935761 RepID=A0AAP0QJB6_9ROSI
MGQVARGTARHEHVSVRHMAYRATHTSWTGLRILGIAYNTARYDPLGHDTCARPGPMQKNLTRSGTVQSTCWTLSERAVRGLCEPLVGSSILQAKLEARQFARSESVFRRAPKEFRVDPKKLRDKAQRNEVLIRKAKELHLSSYVLTCAYVYVFLVKATGEEGDATVMLYVEADCRS